MFCQCSLLNFISVIIEQLMKKNHQKLNISLPAIKHKMTVLTTRNQYQQLEVASQQSEIALVKQLDQWENLNRKPRKLNQKKVTYRQSIARQLKKQQLNESFIFVEVKMFLNGLEGELQRAFEVNYNSIHKNIEYCSGIYQTIYNDILNKIQRFKEKLLSKIKSLTQQIQMERISHIQTMERISQNDKFYKKKIPTIRQQIESKENEIQPIKGLIENLQSARITVLCQCLRQGYDVRDEGLLWILKQLDFQISSQNFPSFLNDKEVKFILNKFRTYNQNLRETKMHQKENIVDIFHKTENQIQQIVNRKKKRQLSMIRQSDILNSIQKWQAENLSSERHRYITPTILNMAKVQLPQSRATKYELIYKQTVKKLNKFCLDEIYKTNRKQEKIKRSKLSLNSERVLVHFQQKMATYLKQAKPSTTSLSEQQKQLDQILRNLRYESYQQKSRSMRNPASIICCLLGWRKAKKMIESEMSYIL